ncbi:hypothetical protein PG984_015372 [Apiospora sp. TS-2023a]
MLFNSILATALLSTPALVYGSFTSSCIHYNWIGEFDTGMRAECLDNNGNFVHTELDFNSCFANDNGNVVWRKNGNAMDSCADWGAEEDCIRSPHAPQGSRWADESGTDLFLPECQLVAKTFWCAHGDDSTTSVCNEIDIRYHPLQVAFVGRQTQTEGEW